MVEEFVILVDENDQEIGVMEKQKAHELGFLHRAFSVFIFNSEKKLLLQQRASHKYHSPNLWTNTCCSHPRKGESVQQAANRRLKEEMGLDTNLRVVGHILYKADLDNSLSEHEYDYILIGYSDDIPKINKEEVKSYKYLTFDEIIEEQKHLSHQYTEWFKLILPRIPNYL